MNNELRELIRRERSRLVSLKVSGKHVEYCSECGRALERRGRRISTTCQGCGRRINGHTG